MTIKLGVVMDPIEKINFKKDSTLAMLLEAQSRGYELYYMEQSDLFIELGLSYASMRPIKVSNTEEKWFDLSAPTKVRLSDLDAILMRKDPPFDMNFIYTTYLLEQAEREGVLIVNKPQSLRDCNEKLFAAQFPQCCPPLLISSDQARIQAFIAEQRDVICKPLDGMGGASIFRITENDPNASVILETLTEHGKTPIMAQRYIKEITAGDKRILIIDGKPIPYALARIPAEGETRGNLAAGGTGKALPLSQKDLWICEQVGPTLVEKGLIFVGIDVIGDYLTEINVTSPTCIRELDQAFNLNISAVLMDAIEARLAA
ncbi:MAG: glutathione synthase [Gammaproteobacteria bacterium]|nr:MAG: glutathione synthase [Gammaproteobacteria bacterium]